MSNQLRQTIETRLLPYVQKPMRYAGQEINCIRKNLIEVAVHGVLCFPDLYDIGMSHTGLQILYHVVNQNASWALSRCFHPWADAEEILRRERIPLYTLEYFSPVRKADWVGFSVQYELHFTNIVNMLDLAGIAPLRADRNQNDPLIIAGGPCAGNPEPLAPFIDVFVIGDGEAVLPQVVGHIDEVKSSGAGRTALLSRLAEIQGLYLPQFHRTAVDGVFQVPRFDSETQVRAAKIPVLDSRFYPEKPVVPLIEVVHRRLAVEVMRGCTRGCRFCSAGMYYRPVRERTPGAVCRQIESGVAATGWDEVGLLSLSTADYSSFPELLTALSQIKRTHHISCSLPSTRLDALNGGQLDLLDRVSSISSFTIAPEAGSERLRRVINKDFSDETIYGAVGTLMQRNVQTLKLYFMIGLPTEDHHDIEAIVAMVARIADMVRHASRRRMVNVSISPFSPKPHTPFERESMDSPEVLIEKSTFIKQRLRSLKNVKVTYRNPDQTLLETLLARGDRSVGDLVYCAWRNGARFDGWDECFNLERWKNCAGSLSLSIDPFIREIDSAQRLPWSMVTTGVSTEFLARERVRSRNAQPTADCRTGECTVCGVCDRMVQPVFTEPHFAEPVSDSFKEVRKGGGVYHYRFHYRKAGLMRFLGHLDMVAVIHRACLMARLPVGYSQGFNPHPRIAFGPPLPFAVAGQHEAFDIVTVNRLDDDPLKMNRWLPEDLVVTDFVEITSDTPSINSSISAAGYTFIIPSKVSCSDLAARMEVLLSRKEIIITFEKKGKFLQKNIREGIRSLELLQDEPYGFTALLSMNVSAPCKPFELVGALGLAPLQSEIFITRTECIFN